MVRRMNVPPVLALGLLLLCLPAAPAQSPPPASPAPTPTPTPPPMPADQKAFGEARRIKDPQQRVAALEKFLADHPTSFMAGQVHQLILDTLIKNSPDQKERILAQAQRTVEAAPESGRFFTYNSVANLLLDANLFPNKAEEFAAKGLAGAEEDLAKRRRQLRASNLSTLGRAYLKNGKVRPADKALKEAYALDPASAPTALGLAELAEKRGKRDTALDYLAAATVAGRAPAGTREKLEGLYRLAHQGSLDGLEGMLDAKYEKAFPNPVKPERYQPTAARSNRAVLAEVFTGSGCPPCVAADLGFDALMERYPRRDVVVVMYHLHIPAPDPMTNPSTQARAKFYGVSGVPSYFIDGARDGGGGARDRTAEFYNRLKPKVEARLEKAAEAEIRLDATLAGTVVKVAAAVDQLKGEAQGLRLQVALVEERLRYGGENGVRFHPMVVRSLGGEKAGGFALEPGKPVSLTVDFDLAVIGQELKKHLDEYEAAGHRDEKFTFSEKKHAIDPQGLAVVAFVQDEKSKQVLQAAYLRVKSTVAASGQ